MDDHIEEFLKQNYECFDRFTFDMIFRFLLSEGFCHEEAKDLILYYCALSALVLQERIYNYYYEKITESESISEDLQQLQNEAFNAELGRRLTELLNK